MNNRLRRIFGLLIGILIASPASNFPIIDGHDHLMGRFRSPRGPVVDFEGAAEVALSFMDRVGIERMVIMPPPFPHRHPNRYEIEDMLPIVKRYPHRFALLGGGGSLNAMIHRVTSRGINPKLFEQFKRRAIEILAKGAIGFGEIAIGHLSLSPRHPYQWVSPDHPLLLLLADIAARFHVPIDVHMEAVPHKIPLPEGLPSPPNPPELQPNMRAFERFLAHNRRAKIIWAHAGWDNTGYRTPSLCQRLLERHPNLYMSIKISPDSRPENSPLDSKGRIKPGWLKLIGTFPDRFFIGSDLFFVTPKVRRKIGPSSTDTLKLLSQLPPSLAHKVGYENVRTIFNLH